MKVRSGYTVPAHEATSPLSFEVFLSHARRSQMRKQGVGFWNVTEAVEMFVGLFKDAGPA